MKVLVVEDEPNVVSFIRRGLMEAGHEVSVAMDGVTALQMIKSDLPDIALFDVMLPGMNGIELCRQVRALKIKLPIIMLTALGTTENVVSGLENGADDYLVKPFKFAELLARMTAVTRRTGDTYHCQTGRHYIACRPGGRHTQQDSQTQWRTDQRLPPRNTSCWNSLSKTRAAYSHAARYSRMSGMLTST